MKFMLLLCACAAVSSTSVLSLEERNSHADNKRFLASVANFFHHAAETVRDGVVDAAHSVAGAAETAAHAVAGAAETAAHSVVGAAETAAHSVAGAAETAAHSVAGAAETAAHSVAGAAETAAHSVAGAAETAAHAVAGAAETAVDKYVCLYSDVPQVLKGKHLSAVGSQNRGLYCLCPLYTIRRMCKVQ